MTGYEALRSRAAWISLASHGLIQAAGDDRARFLHAMATNHIQQLQPGQSCWTMFLNAKGQIQGEAEILAFPDHFLLDTGPHSRQKLVEHLDRFIIADDVTLTDVTDTITCLAVEGPEAAASLAFLETALPALRGEHVVIHDGVCARLGETSFAGYRFYLPVASAPAFIERLTAAGIPGATEEEARVVRLENGKASHGTDYLESNLPHETQLLYGVHFNKGCYLGQEIVERVRSRGAVNRLLVRVALDTQQPPPAGAAILGAEGGVGRLRDCAYSPAQRRVVGFALLRAEIARNPAALQVEGVPVEVVAARPLLPD